MEPIYFVHISDTHVGPTSDYQAHGYVTLPGAEKAVDLINQLPMRPDFVIHTGDVVTDPSNEAYALAAEVLNDLEVPVYYTTGNHDRARDIRHYLKMGAKHDYPLSSDVLTYTFNIRGWQFLVLDGRGPDEIDPHGILSEQQLQILHDEVTGSGPPLTIFIHFPVVGINSPWMDANMLVINGRSMHEILQTANRRVCGVFYGHIHNSIQTIRDGILYCSVGSTFLNFRAWPNNTSFKIDEEVMPAINFVQLLPEQLIIQQRPFIR